VFSKDFILSLILISWF